MTILDYHHKSFDRIYKRKKLVSDNLPAAAFAISNLWPIKEAGIAGYSSQKNITTALQQTLKGKIIIMEFYRD